MIKVIIKQDNKYIVSVNVSGHADSDEHGKDLVCAGVSTACIGIANQLSNVGFLTDDLGTIQIRDGYIDIKVNQSRDDVQLILETFETLLKTIEESYHKYIEIMKTEV